MQARKTKIIATLGPATDNPDVLRELVASGVDVARFNFSHGDHESIRKRLDAFRAVCAELGSNAASLADTKGPEIRLGDFEGGHAELAHGSEFRLTTGECLGNSNHAFISYPGLPGEVSEGVRILIDDGLIVLEVKSAYDSEIITKVINGGRVGNRKSVNVPSANLHLPFISGRDRADLRVIVELGFDYVAASFTRSADDIRELRAAMQPLIGCRRAHDQDGRGANVGRAAGAGGIQIIAKIENAEGVANLESIIEASDGLMVARGDLGVEMPYEHIPILQKRMIQMCNTRGKAVITATQMLESMIVSPRPTRAEVSDVANAIFDGTGAIMLSGETAAGKYPVEAVRTMANVAEHTENSINYINLFRAGAYGQDHSVVNAISRSAVSTAHELGAAAILAVTLSGATARNIAKFRPSCPIVACATDPAVVRQLSLVWGVLPIKMDEQHETAALLTQAAELGAQKAGLSGGDLVVIAAGIPLGAVGATNMIKVHEIGENYEVF